MKKYKLTSKGEIIARMCVWRLAVMEYYQINDNELNWLLFKIGILSPYRKINLFWDMIVKLFIRMRYKRNTVFGNISVDEINYLVEETNLTLDHIIGAQE